MLQRNTASDPRAEWALRWLLKKLQQPEISPGSRHLKPKAWILLQELVVRTPITSVARLLSTHKFMEILQNTLGWLQKQVNRAAVSPDVVDGNEGLFDWAKDNANTLESSSDEQRTSKKRKLDGTEVIASEDVASTATSVFGVLYLAICGTVRQLQSLTIDVEQTKDFAVEHLKSCLRSSPGDAAHILGSSFYLTNRIIQASQRHWHRKRMFKSQLQKELADTGYRSCILPAIDLWSRRSLVGQRSSISSNVRSFEVSC